MSLDIVPADKEKWYLRIAMNWFIKKYSGGKNSKTIHEEMKSCGNPIIRYFLRLKDETVKNITANHQIKMVDEVSEFLFWILYKDTAYRQIFFWAMKKVLDDKEKLMPMLEEYHREPEDWYVNVWQESKKMTQEKKEKGEIGKKQMSEAELYFVPQVTWDRINKELEKEAKKKGV